MARTWRLELRDPITGEEAAFEGWQRITINEDFSGARAEIEIPASSHFLAGYITELLTDVLIYSDGELVYRMRIIDSEDTMTTEAHTVKLECVSYESLLTRRVLFDDMDRAADQHLWAWDLIAYTQGFQDFGITQAPTFAPAGQNRDRVLQRGLTIADAIDELAKNDNGFDWWINENLQFDCQTPRRVIPLDLDLLWGAQISEMSRANAIDTYASCVLVIGATNETNINGTVYPPPTPQVYELTDKPYGRWAKTITYSDVVTTASLIEKAIWNLSDSATLRPQYNVTLVQGIWTPVFTPGVTFLLRVRSAPRLDFKVVVRVESLTLDLGPDGVEQCRMGCRAEEEEVSLSPVPGLPSVPPTIVASPPNAVLITPAGPTGRSVVAARTSDTASLGALLASFSDRLARQERST